MKRFFIVALCIVTLLLVHVTENRDKLIVAGVFGQDCVVWLYKGEIVVDYYGQICTPVFLGVSAIKPTGRKYDFYAVSVGVAPYGNVPIHRGLTIKNFMVRYLP